MEKGWIKIQTYTDTVRGEMDKQILEESGISAVLLNKKDSSFMFGKIDLYVHEQDGGQAQRLIQGSEADRDEN